MNNGGNGSGCMAGILVFCALGGNIFLFTGALNDDLKDNPFAWIMVIIAIVADVALVGYIISACTKSFERHQKEKEKQLIDEATQRVNNLIEQFTPKKTMVLQKNQPYIAESKYINQEVVSTVNQYKTFLKDKFEKCCEVDKTIAQILSCSGCYDLDEKEKYILSKSCELQQLKSKSDLIHDEISKIKIKVLNESTDNISPIKAAFATLLLSKKCVIENHDIKAIISEEIPTDLSLFDYKYAPTILHIDDFFYCLFNDFILVFDSDGIFATALDPSALNLEVERVSTDMLISNNILPAHQFVDIDSKCIKQGKIRHTWAYTCRDGSPDLRYSYNPSIEFHTDTYEYGIITISLLNTGISINISSTHAIESFVKAKNKYNRKCNNRHNSIPELLQLLSNTSEIYEQSIVYISEKYMESANGKNYFCQII